MSYQFYHNKKYYVIIFNVIHKIPLYIRDKFSFKLQCKIRFADFSIICINLKFI